MAKKYTNFNLSAPVNADTLFRFFKQLLRRMFIPLEADVDEELFLRSVTGGENPVGYVKLKNGKMAQVRILIETDEKKWIADDGMLVNHFHNLKKKTRKKKNG